jgi:hypothetical protein
MSAARPDGFAGRWSLQHLAADRARHLDALLRHRHVEALPAPEVAEHTLAVLVLSERLVHEARAGRWVYATEALAAGASPGEVATAMGLRDEHEFRAALRHWADQQAHRGLLSTERRRDVLELIAGAGLPPGVDTAVVAEMRAWLCDCTWADVDTADIALMPDPQIVAAVERHWAGGVTAFLREVVDGDPGRGAEQ